MSASLAIFKAPGLKTFAVILNLISTFLLIFLALACHSPGSTFSEIFLIQARTNSNTYLRSGYFRMCEDASNSTSPFKHKANIHCQKLGQFKGKETAFDFSRHVARPYFVVIAAVFSVMALFFSIASVMSRKTATARASYTVTLLTLAFTLITACWQQVAVQAAVVLIPKEVKRGYRASGMVWGAVSMLILSTFSQIPTKGDDDIDLEVPHDDKSLNSGGSAYSNMTAQKPYHQQPIYISHPRPV